MEDKPIPTYEMKITPGNYDQETVDPFYDTIFRDDGKGGIEALKRDQDGEWVVLSPEEAQALPFVKIG